MLWHIGNTTVRTPYRLQEALRALLNSPLNGDLAGRAQEHAFAVYLHEQGIVNVERLAEGQDASDLGRKWRSALMQLGFITPMLTRMTPTGTVDPALSPMVEGIDGLSGRPYELTPNGHRLANADIITAQQECFLRSLASYRIPSPIERDYAAPSFSPLRFVLQIMHGLGALMQSVHLSFQEFALFVQTATPAAGIDKTVEKIIAFRTGRIAAAGDVRAYDRQFYAGAAAELGRQEQTLDDYADLSFRYLKSTGIFRNAGRGIALVPARAQLAELLRQQVEPVLPDRDYLVALWQGARLPTDEPNSALIVVADLVEQLSARGVATPMPAADTAFADLEIIRHGLEARLAELDEIEYADDQVNRLEEILGWIDAIINRRPVRLASGETLIVPRLEYPAYLEWVIWRAFLAINSLVNASWDARRFQIDQDFMPVGCAAGGGPDMVFEFADAIVVVEVTLTANARQEAAEGEPVRRHVAVYAEASAKPVYGLFLAVRIDSNTAHTFRSGDWYRADDTKMSLDIVPVALSDFRAFFASGNGRLNVMPALLRQLLIECRARANQDAPAWKTSISGIVNRLSTP